MQSFGCQLFLTLLEEPISDTCPCIDNRSYSATGDGQVHENPEWEKARQALASINKTQNPAKNSQANRSTTEVHPFLFLYFLHVFEVLRVTEVVRKSNLGLGLVDG